MPGLQIKVEQGELRGCSRTTAEGFQYNCYLGIPYAKPPLGNLRFKDPQPPEHWSGIRDAISFGSSSAQNDLMIAGMYRGSEDSLFINVYAPAFASENEKLPVMFWIHGGGYAIGSGDDEFFGEEHLVAQNVILVTFNYRLGPLGFLCLNTPEVPGNAAMKDQVLALKWVQKNIAQFGGDPGLVTIFGESAGSTSVNHHVLSRMTKGLFHRAIMQSGSALSLWSIQLDPEKNAFNLAKSLGCDSKDKDVILEFLRQVPAEDLAKAVSVKFDIEIELNFVPVVEKEFFNVEAFYLKDPLTLMETGDFNRVPLICGFNSKEALIIFNKSIQELPKTDSLESIRKNIETLLNNLTIKYVVKSGTVDAAMKEYVSNSTNLMEDFLACGSDLYFGIDLDDVLRRMVKFSESIYFYIFSYSGSLNTFRDFIGVPYEGACHADELNYLFKSKIALNNPVPTPSDIITRKRLLELWTNFARYGNPTPKLSEMIDTIWKPIRDGEHNCLQIDKDLKMIVNPLSNRMKFWKNLLTFK